MSQFLFSLGLFNYNNNNNNIIGMCSGNSGSSPLKQHNVKKTPPRCDQGVSGADRVLMSAWGSPCFPRHRHAGLNRPRHTGQ
ncbi:hypothetical protein FKM82_021394 [Ascaphus truei]